MYCPNPIHAAERVEVVASWCSNSIDVAHGPRLADQSRDVFHLVSNKRYRYIRHSRKSIERVQRRNRNRTYGPPRHTMMGPKSPRYYDNCGSTFVVIPFLASRDISRRTTARQNSVRVSVCKPKDENPLSGASPGATPRATPKGHGSGC